MGEVVHTLKRTVSRTLLASLAVVAFGAGALVPAHAAPTGLSADEVAQIRASIGTYGVSEEVQDALIAKLEAGQTWDALSGATPVDTSTVIVDGQPATVETYADGSITATSIEEPTTTAAGPSGLITPQAVTGCTVTNSGLTRIKTGCKVKHTNGMVTLWFTATYRQTFSASDPTYATAGGITAVSNGEAMIIGGTYSFRSLTITQAKATASSPAKARIVIDGTLVNDIASKTAWLQLNVPMNTYTLGYTTHN